MSLTQSQIKNIHKLNRQITQQVLHECVERLGLVSVADFCKITGYNRRTTYDHIKNKKILSLVISNHIFIILNET